MADKKIVLSSEISTGTGDASDEFQLLKDVFVDTGYTGQLKSIQNPKCIILGPTGAGKTALVSHLVDSVENIIQIHPDDLSISYIHRSSIIQDMEKCGVNLAPVFRFMWQHVFLVELIRLKFNLDTENSISRWIDRLKSQYLPGSSEFQAVQYMEKWDHNIWDSVNRRVQEMTNSLENAIKNSASISISHLGKLSSDLTANERTEKKEQYESVVQSYISQELIKEQKKIMDICINSFFAKTKPLYLIIDDLDKDWAPNDLKGLLLKSLFMAIKHLKCVPNVKIIIALREDIKHQLFHDVNTPGFQEDKFESLELRLSWNAKQLRIVANNRINASFKSKYTNAYVTIEQIFSSFQINKQTPFNYLISRTRMRPRELILFLNTCIERARSENMGQISRNALLSAEKQYSGKRIQAVHDEWCQVYPCIKVYFNLLRRKPATYSVGRFLNLDSTDFRNDIAIHPLAYKDPIGAHVGYEGAETMSDRKMFREMIKIYYQCGIIGMKTSAELPEVWSSSDDPVIEDTAFDSKAKMKIHPAFYSVLGTNLKSGVLE